MMDTKATYSQNTIKWFFTSLSDFEYLSSILEFIEDDDISVKKGQKQGYCKFFLLLLL